MPTGLRLSAHQKCWPEQEKMEADSRERCGPRAWTVCGRFTTRRRSTGLSLEPKKWDGGVPPMDPRAPLIVAERCNQPSFVHGVFTHQGPIRTVANWSGNGTVLVGGSIFERIADEGGVRPVQHALSETYDPLFKTAWGMVEYGRPYKQRTAGPLPGRGRCGGRTRIGQGFLARIHAGTRRHGHFGTEGAWAVQSDHYG